MNQRNSVPSNDHNWRIFASYFTIAGSVLPFANNAGSPFDLASRVDAAARAGFCGLGLDTSDLRQCVERYGYTGIRKLLSDAGLDYFELEVLVNWFADGPARAASDRDRKELLRAASEIDTAQIKVIGAVGSNHELSRMVDEFGTLCDQARIAGTAINIEIYPDSNVHDLATARAIIEGAGRPNGPARTGSSGTTSIPASRSRMRSLNRSMGRCATSCSMRSCSTAWLTPGGSWRCGATTTTTSGRTHRWGTEHRHKRAERSC